jgi:hypothetical protein
MNLNYNIIYSLYGLTLPLIYYLIPLLDGGPMKLIPLTQGQFAKVDDHWFDYLSQWNWSAWWNETTKTYYAARSVWATGASSPQRISMHRVIKSAEEWQVIDHDDKDTLNNQEYNLFACSVAENNRNHRLRSDSTSGVSGVNYHVRMLRWGAFISLGGKKYTKYYDSKPEAVDARLFFEQLFYKRECDLPPIGYSIMSELKDEFKTQ